ncbi:hypothetical protein R6Z07M_001384 [Ovis aries]
MLRPNACSWELEPERLSSCSAAETPRDSPVQAKEARGAGPHGPERPSAGSGGARGAVPGEGREARPRQSPARAAPEAPDVPRRRQSRAPPSRRLRARLPAPSAVMGAAPCGAAPAPPRPFRPREPARDWGTAGVLPPAAGLALLGGPGPGEFSSIVKEKCAKLSQKHKPEVASSLKFPLDLCESTWSSDCHLVAS